jgi:hypothetical protein
VRVIRDRVADVHLIDRLTRRDESYLGSTYSCMANVRLLLGGKIRLMVLGIHGQKTLQAYRVESSILIPSVKKPRGTLTHVHSFMHDACQAATEESLARNVNARAQIRGEDETNVYSLRMPQFKAADSRS